MKFHQAKKYILASLLIANLLVLIPVPRTITYAAAEPSCIALNDPAKLAGWVVTILEEQISAEDPVAGKTPKPDNQVVEMKCLRTTKPEDVKKGDKTETIQKVDYQEAGANAKCEAGKTCSVVLVLFSQSGTGLLYYYIGLIYRWAAATIGMVCVLFLVLGGVKITTSGDSGGVEEGKEKLIQSIGGLVLLFLSGVILYTINPNFFVQ